MDLKCVRAMVSRDSWGGEGG
ncbi:hypothetical protein E2C01_075023 [Portunus trituberculatus]|uniref:Uncharacterized protein n=1 Tax=Portunus trituberculatus TaxID=210409 RepID=A0A5B7IDU8_PORTR|nr:hypothetical protein [Portunus trituberculatus]